MKEEIETKNVAEMARSENRQADEEIKVTPEMIEAGKREFCSFDSRFEPEEAAVVRIFRVMMALSKSGERRVVLASSVVPFLVPYLGKAEGTSRN